MEISNQAMQLLQLGGLATELEAVVLGARTFKAEGRDVAKINVLGTPGGPTGHNIKCNPYGIFELDAELSVFQALGDILEPR